MHKTSPQSIILFIVLCSVLMLFLISFIAWIIYRYQQKQNAYFKSIEEIKAVHENILLQSQIEMQEMTFQHISKEIHDNLGQKLALAKLLLNTLPYHSPARLSEQVESSVEILGQVVTELSNISRSMSNEILLANDIIKATEAELCQIKKSSVYTVNFKVSGETMFLESNKELVLFRVIQECLHNILKHAEATTIDVRLAYDNDTLRVEIGDNGKGFNTESKGDMGTGLKNIKKRILFLQGTCSIISSLNNGTQIIIEIPINENKFILQDHFSR